MSENSVFREAWSPEMTSQLFPVPHRKWNLTLLVHQNTGKENRYGKYFKGNEQIWNESVDYVTLTARVYLEISLISIV